MKEYKAYEGDEIYAMKPQPNRFLSFFYEGNKIIITNAFTKKVQKLRKRDKDRAIHARADYIKRVKAGVYYEDEAY
ncbi:MAG: type II toxin-antitoxin system RelE/ParE family toxin [Lachnospiraceae bacterium]|nr:type II toxin-antitoxin system RelE/ParE family toxin [Lachnospiraceae bacterium]